MVVDATRTHQKIRGFGASSAWYSGPFDDELADLFFSETNGLGLSLLRQRIQPDGLTGENHVADKALERGVQLWAAPWSPPGEWKTSGTERNGGRLEPEHYQDWADRLATFAANQARNGRPLMGLSAQNEPNWIADWETCEWTPDEFVTFIRDHLAPALHEASPSTLLIAPESNDWGTLATFTEPLLADEDTRRALDVVAVHSYGGTAFEYSSPADNQKEFWQTEISYHTRTGFKNALETAERIHDHLTVANVNAWHYWWMFSDDPSSLMQDGVLVAQAYALGQFSKFIRPGALRIDASPVSPVTGIRVSAYAHPRTGRLVIVAINGTETALEQTFELEGSQPAELTPYVTSETQSLEPQAPISAGETFTYELAASSITTFVGQGPVTDFGAGGAGGAGGEGGETAEGGAGGEGGAFAEAGATQGEGGAAGARASSDAGNDSVGNVGEGGAPSRPSNPGEAGAPANGGSVNPLPEPVDPEDDLVSGRRARVVSPLGCATGGAPKSPAAGFWLSACLAALALRRKSK